MPDPTGYFGWGGGAKYYDKIREDLLGFGEPGGAQWAKDPLGYYPPPDPASYIPYEDRQNQEKRERVLRLMEVALNAGRTYDQGRVDLRPKKEKEKQGITDDEWWRLVYEQAGVPPEEIK